jgi:hypothetical protein
MNLFYFQIKAQKEEKNSLLKIIIIKISNLF